MGQALKVIKFGSEEEKSNKSNPNKNTSTPFNSKFAPLMIAAVFTAILGVVSLVLEVRIYFQYRYEIYLARLVPTLFSFLIVILLQTKFGKKNHVLLTHIFLLTIFTSLSFVSYKISSLLFYNLSAASLFLLGLSLFLFWGKINHAISIIYLIVLFSASAFASGLLYSLNEFSYLIFSTSLIMLLISFFAVDINGRKLKIGKGGGNVKKISEPNDLRDESFIDDSIIPFFQFNLNGELEYHNRAFQELLEIPDEKLIELNFFNDVLKNEKVRNHFLKKIENKGRVENYRFTLRKNESEKIVLSMDCKSKIIADKALIEGTLRNITQQYLKDKELLEELHALKIKKRQGNSVIPNYTEKDVKGSNIISRMGHELRTPMNSVIGFLTLIENGLFENEEELKEFSHSAKLSAESLLGLISDVVEISKIQDGSVEIFNSEFNLREEIDKLILLLGSHLKYNELNIICNIDEDIPEVIFCDQSKYFQILSNLLRNAINVSENGEITISIKSEKQSGKMQLLTSVEDTGSGMTPDDLEDLLHYKLDSKDVDKKVTAGMLHIMISRELTKLLEGTFSGISELGEGTIFNYSIELEKFTTTNDSENISIEEKNINYSNKSKLLLVEDNPISRKVEQKLLQEAGYDVDCVDNGSDAIEYVEKGIYDLILMDIELKDINGLEATQLIRQLPDNICNIPIIAVTAHSSMKDREKCLVAGMNDYISKPINITFLKMTIDQWLNETRVRGN